MTEHNHRVCDNCFNELNEDGYCETCRQQQWWSEETYQ